MKYKSNLKYLPCARCGKIVLSKMSGPAATIRKEMVSNQTLCDGCITPEEREYINRRIGELIHENNN